MGNIRYKLEDILAIGLVTLVCNGQDFEDIEVFGRQRETGLRKFLELPGGIPDESIFFRVFRRVKPKALSGYLYEWLCEGRELGGALINIDGKRICGSERGDGGQAVHVVSAWVGEQEYVLLVNENQPTLLYQEIKECTLRGLRAERYGICLRTYGPRGRSVDMGGRRSGK
ncbi:MAG: ISAs1 family transposase [Treponema sp.]|nr:ISAs1 family transposase [Treponema sp.]